MGWKVPIESIAPDYKTSDQVRKLDQPPGESAFFLPGDELWDVSKVLLVDTTISPLEPGPKAAWTGDWAVWNRRSEMLVARGDYIHIRQAQQACGFDESPRVVGMRFHLTQSGAKRSVAVFGENGERKTGRIDGLEIDVEGFRSSENSFDVMCNATWKSEVDDATWNVVASFHALAEKDVLIARLGSGDSAWELHVSVRLESIGGIPAKEARWIETGPGPPRPWLDLGAREPLFPRQVFAKDLIIAAYQLPPPFVEHEYLLLPSLEAPDSLHGWVHGPFRDVSKVLNDNGVDLEQPGTFAGVEMRTNQLILVANKAAHDLAQALVGEISEPLSSSIQIESSPDHGNWSLIVGDGLKSVIWLTRSDGVLDTDVGGFEIEASLAEEPGTVNLSYHCNPGKMPGPTSAGTIELKVGEWLEIPAAEKPAKQEAAVRLRATVLAP